jgi:hypothetical protein
MLRQKRRKLMLNRSLTMMHATWIAQARAHWQEHQPTKFKTLRAAGTLDEALVEAAQRTADEIQSLVSQGFNRQEAWEMTREKYLFPPEESDQAEQPESPGYQTALEVNQALNSLRMPGERDD